MNADTGQQQAEVEGRRPSWCERHPGSVPKLVALLIPGLLGASAAGYGWCVHRGVSEYPAAGTAFAILGMSALALLVFGGLHGTRGWFFSACPVCGHEAARDFRGGQAAECGQCMAYLREEGGRIRQESDEALERVARYAIRAPDAGGVAPDSLAFPDACVLCGAPAVERLPIHSFRLRPAQASRSGPAASRRRITLDEQQWGPVAPVCEAHRGERRAVEILQGELQFCSYGQYRAFCRRNGIDRRRRAD